MTSTGEVAFDFETVTGLFLQDDPSTKWEDFDFVSIDLAFRRCFAMDRL